MNKIVAVFFCICLLWSSVAQADPHPQGFVNNRLNGSSKPITKNGVTTFQIFDKQCSNVDYGDGRGENDCQNGAVRSALSKNSDAKLGSIVNYRFDIWIDKSFSYPGYYNDHATGYLSGAWDSRLRIASWEGHYIHNFLYMLKADARNGITFLGKQCQKPEKFGEWVTFSMKVRWSSDKSGWMEVKCDDITIYISEGVATNQNPHCYITNQCEIGVMKNPKNIHFILGPVMAGFGYEWKKFGYASQFTDIQKEGITVKVRNVSVRNVSKR